MAGENNVVDIKSWNQNGESRIEAFSAGNSVISDTSVEQLIQAMATFSTDNGGISWEQALLDQPNDVHAIVAAHWS